MSRVIISLVLLALSAAPFRAAQADGPRAVTERYQISSEAPEVVDCRVPTFVWVGFGPSVVEFPVRAGERSVDIRIDDDLHDNPVKAFVTQAEGEYGEPGTWICGSERGIPITTDAPVKVWLPQSLTAPVTGGSVFATFYTR